MKLKMGTKEIDLREVDGIAFLDMLLFFGILKRCIYDEIKSKNILSYCLNSSLVMGVVFDLLKKGRGWESVMELSYRLDGERNIIGREDLRWEKCNPYIVISDLKLKEIYDFVFDGYNSSDLILEQKGCLL